MGCDASQEFNPSANKGKLFYAERGNSCIWNIIVKVSGRFYRGVCDNISPSQTQYPGTTSSRK